ncbi:10355_t:CDS:2 [Cetraspora pellucida]|uniref:10355_t:CDS:1 n=1 Tax=Cetraspora pellucida TaxID=1433469 RepID=A0ACA9M906_9GLOM|nr:10355_t:CDS:2 [Cetraspora pellucida]
MRFSRSNPHPSLPLYKEHSKYTLNIRNSKQILIIGLAYIILIFLIVINFFNFLPFHNSEYLPIKKSDYSDYSYILPNPSHSGLQDLIIVAGHAIYLGNGLEKVEQDNNWILEDFQKGGAVKTFLNHIRKGVELTQQNPKALLVFSGGQTRPAAGPRSEAQSYYVLAQTLDLLSAEENSHLIFGRMTTEEYARDSYENLLFSICRFKEVTGHYPRNEDSALELFRHDIYACHDSRLRKKKLARNPFRRRHPYDLSCPSLSDLIDYCPHNPTSIFSNKLPWETYITK